MDLTARAGFLERPYSCRRHEPRYLLLQQHVLNCLFNGQHKFVTETVYTVDIEHGTIPLVEIGDGP
jgi:hypothetical protein